MLSARDNMPGLAGECGIIRNGRVGMAMALPDEGLSARLGARSTPRRLSFNGKAAQPDPDIHNHDFPESKQ